MENFSDCCAVCVTYHPEQENLLRLAQAALAQVDHLYCVNNGPLGSLPEPLVEMDDVQVIEMHDNLGVAAGFNAGIHAAKVDGYRYVLLLDQDSVPPPGMVSRYLETLDKQRSGEATIAALGPRYMEPSSGYTSSFINFRWLGNSYRQGTAAEPSVKADFLISSGTFLPLDIFEQVGDFNEGLFIDHVDTEWCHRAIDKGYRLLGLWDVVMEHSLGEKRVRLWFLRWRYQPIHKPFRLYYITRNSLLLYRMDHVPGKWVSGDLFRLLRLVVMNILFSAQRLEAVCWFVLGVRDGLRGVFGVGPKRAVQ